MPIDLMVLVAAFASGLLGTVHCAAMCGGIATSLSTGQRDGLWMAALPNLGRVLGYALAGAIVGGIGGGLLGIARIPELGIAMRALVGIVLVIAGLRLLLGLVWGWMPCGLSTTLLAAAWLQASAAHGALTMAAFGLGTLPMMIPLTWAGARIGQRLQRGGLRSIAGTLVIAAGLLTLAGPWLLHAPVLHRVLEALGCRSLPA